MRVTFVGTPMTRKKGVQEHERRICLSKGPLAHPESLPSQGCKQDYELGFHNFPRLRPIINAPQRTAKNPPLTQTALSSHHLSTPSPCYLFITLLVIINCIEAQHPPGDFCAPVLDLIHLHPILDDIHPLFLSLFTFHHFVYHLPQARRTNEWWPFLHRFFGQRDGDDDGR
jgi:hypothetical protein